MLLEIDNTKKLSELQDRFSECFPNLKIEFYRRNHHWVKASPIEEMLSPELKVADARKTSEPGVLSIRSEDKAGEVENRFHDEFGLNVQIFFLRNEKWIQTARTDNLNLVQLQNAQ